jgi:predicted ATPase
MTAILGQRGRMPPLTDRNSERAALDRFVDAVRAGESQALVVRGDPGVGKTVLLDHLAEQASGSECRGARAVGMQSEMELAFAGLHQLCAPMLNRAERLPAPSTTPIPGHEIVEALTEMPRPRRFGSWSQVGTHHRPR